jgi:transcriptional repressor BetI
MAPVRKAQLIDATIQCIHEEGVARSSVQRISKRAGLSPGVVAHYFEDKDGLLVATLLRLNKGLADEIIARMQRAETPVDRLWAILDAHFEPVHFTPEVVDAWFALWGKMREIPDLQRVQRIYEARLRSNLRHSLRPLVSADRVEVVADALGAMIDGLWAKSAQPTTEITADRARAVFADALGRLLER